MTRSAIVFGTLVLAGCTGNNESPERTRVPRALYDPHSFARPHEVRVEHIDLDLTVDFESRTLDGRASLQVLNLGGSTELWLDTADLTIRSVRLDPGERRAEYHFGDEAPHLGRPLIVEIDPQTTVVHIDYATAPEAAGLQWLDPSQTAGRRHPFLLTQSQSVFARSWIPCQDSPLVRVTYDATIRVPRGLMALMSAENPTEPAPDGVHTFHMPQTIPTYLLALAVGELQFRPLGRRSGIYAEPEVIDRAAWEFADTEAMIPVAEALYGPYRWERYDLIVLPPGFPFGGMENPRLSFITPTLIAGDRSLVATIAHELAHSWSGNLVTNATWEEVWLNEGFTSYFEKRIMEDLYGRDYSEMLAVLDSRSLGEALDEMGADDADSRLHMDLVGRDPDLGFGTAQYEKGYQFLRMLEETFGREAWDAFLRGYFDEFAFRSMTTERFLEFLDARLISQSAEPAELTRELQIEAWVHGPGLPSNAPRIVSPAFEEVDVQLERWLDGRSASELDTTSWTVHHTTHFVRSLPDGLTAGQLADVDRAFALSGSGNAEVRFAWLMQCISQGYETALPALEDFLSGMGRRKFLEPLYKKLAESPAGLAEGRRIYTAARSGYHGGAREALDVVLGGEESDWSPPGTPDGP